MAGIVAYGAYVPLFRLGKGTQNWTGPEKAIANFDEDSLTMAVAAALDCLTGLDRGQVDGLFFASTTSPYREKQASTTIAMAADLRENILTADFTNSLRAGTTALRAALDAVAAGTARQVLVVAADRRVPQPRSELEPIFGDGAAALLVGRDNLIAQVEDSYSLAHEIVDVWRSEDDAYPHSWEDRFVVEEGYFMALGEAVSSLLKKHHLTPKDLQRAVFYAPDGRRHTEMARRLGLDEKSQVQPALFGQLGNTGAALALMLLVAALEEARGGERVLLANYGQGADAFLLRFGDKATTLPPRRGMKAHLASKRILPDYQHYLRWRGLLDVAPAARRPPLPTPSAAAIYREQAQNLRLHGVKCRNCGTVQYPIQRVCTQCHAKDNFEPYRFSGKKASLFTYSMDYLGPTLDPPLVISVVDFEGGGRIMGMMTDRDIKEIKVGMPLDMSFRWLHTVEGIHNYYWKCLPVRA